MPEPTRKVDWRARPDPPKNPYIDSDLERIVQIIVQIIGGDAKTKLSPKEHECLQNKVNRLQIDVNLVARAFILAVHQHKGPTYEQIKAALKELLGMSRSMLKS